MKKYIVFAGDIYYPSRGVNDLRGTFESMQEAMDYLLRSHYEWYQIVDTKTLKIVSQGEKEY
jgi:hypothetical protein